MRYFCFSILYFIIIGSGYFFSKLFDRKNDEWYKEDRLRMEEELTLEVEKFKLAKLRRLVIQKNII